MTIRAIKALTPAVGWSVVFWDHDRDRTPPVEVSWVPVVVWAVCTVDYDGEDVDQVRAVIAGDKGSLSPVMEEDEDPRTGPYCLGLYPTAQQADPTLTAALMADAAREAGHDLRRRQFRTVD